MDVSVIDKLELDSLNNYYTALSKLGARNFEEAYALLAIDFLNDLAHNFCDIPFLDTSIVCKLCEQGITSKEITVNSETDLPDALIEITLDDKYTLTNLPFKGMVTEQLNIGISSFPQEYKFDSWSFNDEVINDISFSRDIDYSSSEDINVVLHSTPYNAGNLVRLSTTGNIVVATSSVFKSLRIAAPGDHETTISSNGYYISNKAGAIGTNIYIGTIVLSTEVLGVAHYVNHLDDTTFHYNKSFVTISEDEFEPAVIRVSKDSTYKYYLSTTNDGNENFIFKSLESDSWNCPGNTSEVFSSKTLPEIMAVGVRPWKIFIHTEDSNSLVASGRLTIGKVATNDISGNAFVGASAQTIPQTVTQTAYLLSVVLSTTEDDGVISYQLGCSDNSYNISISSVYLAPVYNSLPSAIDDSVKLYPTTANADLTAFSFTNPSDLLFKKYGYNDEQALNLIIEGTLVPKVTEKTLNITAESSDIQYVSVNGSQYSLPFTTNISPS